MPSFCRCPRCEDRPQGRRMLATHNGKGTHALYGQWRNICVIAEGLKGQLVPHLQALFFERLRESSATLKTNPADILPNRREWERECGDEDIHPTVSEIFRGTNPDQWMGNFRSCMKVWSITVKVDIRGCAPDDKNSQTVQKTEEQRERMNVRERRPGASVYAGSLDGLRYSSHYGVTVNSNNGSRSRSTTRESIKRLSKRIKTSEDAAITTLLLQDANPSIAMDLEAQLYKRDPNLLPDDEKEDFLVSLDLPPTLGRKIRFEDMKGKHTIMHMTLTEPMGPNWRRDENGKIVLLPKEVVEDIDRTSEDWHTGYSVIWGTTSVPVGFLHLEKKHGWNKVDPAYIALFESGDPNWHQFRLRSGLVRPKLALYGIYSGAFATPVAWLKYTPGNKKFEVYNVE